MDRYKSPIPLTEDWLWSAHLYRNAASAPGQYGVSPCRVILSQSLYHLKQPVDSEFGNTRGGFPTGTDVHQGKEHFIDLGGNLVTPNDNMVLSDTRFKNDHLIILGLHL